MTPAHAERLRRVVEACTPLLLALPDGATARRPAPEKWSPREILGHLIDSAANNHRRFVEAQLREDLVFPGYDQEAWVRTQAYRAREWKELIELWRAYNLHLAHVMEIAPPAVRTSSRVKHNLADIGWDVAPERPVTLDFVMSDYVGHLEHHLRQILGTLPGPEW